MFVLLYLGATHCIVEIIYSPPLSGLPPDPRLVPELGALCGIYYVLRWLDYWGDVRAFIVYAAPIIGLALGLLYGKYKRLKN